MTRYPFGKRHSAWGSEYQKGDMRQRAQVREQGVDVELARLATEGDVGAFEELYRRHVEAAWRMALAVTNNPHDAADAVSDAFTRVFQALPDRPHAAGHFLPYLLAAVRNAAIDGVRRRQRAANPSDRPDWVSMGAEPGDELVADVDATLVARAFRSLPERWRSVLWLVEVEGFAHRDVAGLLHMTPNGVAQLAVRARAGLRQRYLQAHLGDAAVRTACRDTVGRLGAYAAGGLAPRDISKVDQHLAGCEACRSRLAQLEEVTPCLHRAVLPLPSALAALSAARLHLAGGAAGGAAAGASASALPAGVGIGMAAAVVPAPLIATVASAALLVAGVVGAGVVQRNVTGPAAAASAPAPSVDDSALGAASGPVTAPSGGGNDAVTGVADRSGVGAALAGVTDVVDDLARGVAAALPPGTTDTLTAVSQGDVRIDVGDAAGVDLRSGSEGCPSFRIFGLQLRCQGTGAVIEAPGAPADPLDPGAAATPSRTVEVDPDHLLPPPPAQTP